MKKRLEFNLLSNAEDSLVSAVRSIAFNDMEPTETILKRAIQSSAHSIELLLKERLRREHPAFMWRNIDRYPSLDAQTVGTDEAVKRIESLTDYRFSEKDKKTISALRTTRNAIEHFEWSATHAEARTIIAASMALAFDFASSELNEPIEDKLKSDDTWTTFVNELYEFARDYSEKITKREIESGNYPEWCDECGEQTLPERGGSCLLCGHWQYVDD